MKRKEYIQMAVVLSIAVIIGLTISFFIDKSASNDKQATSGDIRLGNGGPLKVVKASAGQGINQSNTDSSITGVPAQAAPEAANPSGSSLQNTGQISVPSSSGLQGGSSSTKSQ
jgi:hypothetical protein